MHTKKGNTNRASVVGLLVAGLLAGCGNDTRGYSYIDASAMDAGAAQDGTVADSQVTDAATGPALAFPRLGAMWIGGSRNYEDPEIQARIAITDIVVMGAWNGWDSSHGGAGTLQSALQAIKALNPKIVIGNYTNFQECRENGATAELVAALDTNVGPGYPGNNDWWVRDADGNRVSNWPGTHSMNTSQFVQPDENGKRLAGVYADFVAAWYFDKVPEFNMVFIDTFGPKPYVNADWDADGVNDGTESQEMKTMHREDRMRYVAELRTKFPEHMIVVNSSRWFTHGDWLAGEPYPDYPEYDQQLNGGVLESVIGKSWSASGTGSDGEQTNSWGSMDLVMYKYRRTMELLAEPKLLMFSVDVRLQNYKTQRYALSMCLMGNAFFTLTDIDNFYNSFPYIDEYTAGRGWSGPSDTKWLGQAADSPQYETYAQGVYLREFDNGLVICNPRENGEQTITLPSGSWARFLGDQDPEYNDGQPCGATLTIADGDGYLLMRQ